MPCLLPRIVALLRLRAPPQGLGSHMLAQLPHQPWPPTGQAQGGPAGQAGQASPGDEAGDLAHEEAEEELEYSEPEYSWEQLGDALGAQQQQQQQPQQQQPQQQQAQTPGAQQHAAEDSAVKTTRSRTADLKKLINVWLRRGQGAGCQEARERVQAARRARDARARGVFERACRLQRVCLPAVCLKRPAAYSESAWSSFDFSAHPVYIACRVVVKAAARFDREWRFSILFILDAHVARDVADFDDLLARHDGVIGAYHLRRLRYTRTRRRRGPGRCRSPAAVWSEWAGLAWRCRGRLRWPPCAGEGRTAWPAKPALVYPVPSSITRGGAWPSSTPIAR